MKLSKRLETIASFVEAGSIAADIGTDHGYIPIWLVREGISPRALAMDVRQGPLNRAGEHVRQWGLETQIALRLSDGMEKLSAGEADTVIIAGMGGRLTIRILEDGRRLWPSLRQFILSPQSELGAVRRFLEAEGFAIRREAMVKEDGKYYTVLKAEWAGESGISQEAAPLYEGSHEYEYDYEYDYEYEYGRFLIRQRDPVLREYLLKEERTVLGILKSLPEEMGEDVPHGEMEEGSAVGEEEDVAVSREGQIVHSGGTSVGGEEAAAAPGEGQNASEVGAAGMTAAARRRRELEERLEGIRAALNVMGQEE